MPKKRFRYTAFTLVEIIIVVMIIGIISLIAVPMFTTAASMQVRSAANMLASDLEYAKSMAIATGNKYFVKFDIANEKYQIFDIDLTGLPIDHPVKVGFNYTIDFANDSRLDKVEIVSALFNGTSSTVEFDSLGTPLPGGGQINLSADGFTMAVKVEAITGYVSIE